MKIHTVFLLLLISLMINFISPENVLACRCARPESLKVYSDRATLVFMGKVISVTKKRSDNVNGGVEYNEIKFKVKKWWKGGDSNEITIIDTVSTCSPGFEVGKKWLVYSTTQESRYYTNICDGTVPFNESQEHLKTLGTATLPKK